MKNLLNYGKRLISKQTKTRVTIIRRVDIVVHLVLSRRGSALKGKNLFLMGAFPRVIIIIIIIILLLLLLLNERTNEWMNERTNE